MKLSHLDYIAKEYDQVPDERGVHPISSADVDIIYMIIARTQLTDPALSKLLANWKAVSDKQLFKKLQDLELEEIDDEMEFDEPTSDSGKGRNVLCSNDFVEIGGQLFDPSDFFRISKGEVYTDRQIYQIKINHIDDKIASIKGVKNVNVTINYYSETQRDQALEKLKQQLAEYRSIRFL